MRPDLKQAVVDTLSPTAQQKPATADWTRFSTQDWEKAFGWLDLSGLALYFWRAMNEAGDGDQLPQAVRDRLQHNEAANRQRMAAMACEFQSLNYQFERYGVSYAVLKGFSLEPDYCPNMFHRAQYDYDYLVRSDSFASAEMALCAAGYCRKASPDGRHATYRPAVSSSRATSGLYSVDLARSVELHKELWNSTEEKIGFDFPQSAFTALQIQESSHCRFPVLSDADALIFQLLHAFRHILHNWCRLAILFEISFFLRGRLHDSNFWPRFNVLVESSDDLAKAAGVVFELASRVFGAPIPASTYALTAGSLPSALTLWVENYGRRSALDNFTQNKFSLLLHREFVPDVSARSAVVRKRLVHFRIPHQLPPVLTGSSAQSQRALKANCAHAFRRVRYHISSNFLYLRESSRWRRMIRHSAAPSEHALRSYDVLKRAFDIAASAAVLVAFSPVFLLIAVLVKLTSPGPALFIQRRVSKNGREFKMIKFRTMWLRPMAESDTHWTTRDDPCITGFGRWLRKTNLDELPQFLNVLMGDMSIVGPRPERPFFLERFCRQIPGYVLRLAVKSGITGWAQVNGWRGDTSISERLAHDLYYVRHQAIILDLKIIFLTLTKSFFDRNTY